MHGVELRLPAPDLMRSWRFAWVVRFIPVKATSNRIDTVKKIETATLSLEVLFLLQVKEVFIDDQDLFNRKLNLCGRIESFVLLCLK